MSVETCRNAKAACCARHTWGREILHTFTAVALVSVRVCTLCGAVKIKRDPFRPIRTDTKQ